MLWECVLENNKPVAVIKEAANITVYKSTHRYRVLDFDIMLLPLVDSLKIGGSEDAKGYGGFCLRLKLPKDVSFISDNKEVIPQETAVTAGEWMNFSGSFESETSTKTGIVVFAVLLIPVFSSVGFYERRQVCRTFHILETHLW